MPILGSTLQFKVNVYDKDPVNGGVLTNAQSIALDITKPDGTLSSVLPANPPSLPGQYEYDYTPATIAGRWVGLWTITLASGFVAKYSQTFDVDNSDPGYLISLNAAKKHLNIPAADTSNDAELLSWLGACTEIVEFYTGPIIQRTVIEYHDEATTLMLEQTPVISVTSIAPYLANGYSYTPAQIAVQPNGRVMRKDGLPFFWGPFTVTYTAGRTSVPASVVSAVKIILEHMWETQRGPSGLPFQSQELDNVPAGLGYLIPNRALELLKALDLGPSVG